MIAGPTVESQLRAEIERLERLKRMLHETAALLLEAHGGTFETTREELARDRGHVCTTWTYEPDRTRVVISFSSKAKEST